VVRPPVLAGELSLSCARLTAGRVTTLWVKRPLSVNQHGQLNCWLALPVAGCWVTAQACVCRLCGDPNEAWRLSFSDGMRVRGVLYMRHAIQIDVFFYLFSVLVRLRELGAELRYVNEKLAPMLWRFTVVDDPQVDIFIVRDADSRLTPRDATVVSHWLRQRPEASAIFHCIRDHPSHSIYPVSGGLWGGRRALLNRLFNGRQVIPVLE